MSARRLRIGYAGARHAQRGFTLLEVLVAMVVAGVGFAMAFAAMSGATRLSHKALLHEAATRLAQTKLEEVLASPGYDLVSDTPQDHYAGEDFGYKVQVRPVTFSNAGPTAPSQWPFSLDQVSIDVYWGPEKAPQRYSLVTYRYSDRPSNASAEPGRGQSQASMPAGLPRP
jgi:prepilin-type N-terminal cleavage/methylation domain-containing protein